MAITLSKIMQNTSGTLGKELVFKRYYDKTVVSRMPDMSRRVLSEKQIELNERMRLANWYAKQNYRTEADKIKARIRLKLPAHKSLYHALVKEHLDLNMPLKLEDIQL